MAMKDLILKNRSYRRFDESQPVDEGLLRSIVDLGRLSPSGGNVQPLKYILSADKGKNAAIFPHLGWAASLKDWNGPAEGERPTAYVIILRDGDIAASTGVDQGISAQSIMLGAVEAGLGGCMLGSVKRDALRTALSIPEQYDIILVLALGHPAETVVLEAIDDSGSVKYYRDPDGTHHVPKRSLDDCILDI